MLPQPPTPPEVVLAIAATAVGCIAGTAAAYAGWRSGNWFAWLCALGCTAFVAGIAGQRVFPSAGSVQALGQAVAATQRPGPWDAGVTLPLIGVRMTPVSLGGLLLAAFGLSMLLLFEHLPDPSRLRTARHRPLEEDDAI